MIVFWRFLGLLRHMCLLGFDEFSHLESASHDVTKIAHFWYTTESCFLRVFPCFAFCDTERYLASWKRFRNRKRHCNWIKWFQLPMDRYCEKVKLPENTKCENTLFCTFLTLFDMADLGVGDMFCTTCLQNCPFPRPQKQGHFWP